MADVTARASDRGQLLIISALALAFLLTLMALALNTAVVGEVQVAQTDDGPREERNVLQFQDSVRRGVGGLFLPVSEQHSEYEAQRKRLESEIASWTDLAKPEHARNAVATNVSLENVSFETAIIQTESKNFTDQNGSTSWTLTDNVSKISRQEMTISRGGLVETSDCTGASGCYTLIVDGENGSWQMYVHTTENASVGVTVESSNGTEECHSTTSPALVDVINGTFTTDGGTCEFTTFLEDEAVDPPFKLTFANANNVNGTYELTVAGRLVNGTIADDPRYGVTGSPRLDPRIVAANVSVKYRSANIVYRTPIHVTPGGDYG